MSRDALHLITDFVALDFEASGLDPAGWPVEIGLSWVTTEGKVETWSALIRRHDSWSMAHWSDQSAAVHGIPLAELLDAPTAETVAREALELCSARIVVSDAPEFELRWLDRLLAAVERSGAMKLRHYDEATFRIFEGRRLDHVYEYLARHSTPHRAGPDSARLAAAWVAADRRAR